MSWWIPIQVKVNAREVELALKEKKKLLPIAVDTMLRSMAVLATRTISKEAPVAKYQRRWDRSFRAGALKRSIHWAKTGELHYVVKGLYYGVLFETGFRGWARSRSKPYVFDSTLGTGDIRTKRGRAVGKLVTSRVKVVRSVGYIYGRAGRVPKNPFIWRGVRKTERYREQILYLTASRIVKAGART